MFVDFTDTPPPPGPHFVWTDLPANEALLLWSLRHLVAAWPRCHTVYAALHRRFGDDSVGVEALLRCWLYGLAQHATRPLLIGDPACARILPDEAAMLFAVRHADRPSGAAAIDRLCGRAAAATLRPIAQAIVRATAS